MAPIDNAVDTQAAHTDKDKKLEEALADKNKLLGILGRLKKSFDGFKARHSDILAKTQQANAVESGDSGCSFRSTT